MSLPEANTGPDPDPAGELSQRTLERIDEEVKRIISECTNEATRQLTSTASSSTTSPRHCSNARP